MTYIAIGPQTYTNILSGIGVDPTGATDSTTGIAAVRSAVSAAGGGVVHWPQGTYVTGNQPIYSNVTDLGDGVDVTIIKLKNGANADLFSANTGNIDLAASTGTSSATGVHTFGFSHMTLDGNKANQTGGPSYPLRFYGYGFILDNIYVKNGYSGGLLYDYNGPFPSNDVPEAKLTNVNIYRNNGIGLQCGGPGDQQWLNVNSCLNISHNVHNAPNGYGLQAVNCHHYTPGTGAVGWIIETTGEFLNCESEDSDTCQVAVLWSQVVWNGGRIFSGASSHGVGLQLGQVAGQTPYPGQYNQYLGLTTDVAPANCMINTFFQGITSANGSLNFVNDGQYNTIIANILQTSGVAVHGTPDATDTYLITVNGLTPDGTLGKGGGQQFASTAITGIVVNNLAGNPLMYYDTYDKNVILGPGVPLYSLDADFSTPNWQLRGGSLCLGPSATAAATATAGTITTSGVGQARVAPTGNITDVILQAGTQPGQTVTVVNESAFTVTFAASGTSHVADGTSAVIAANRKMDFAWDSSTSKWYHS